MRKYARRRRCGNVGPGAVGIQARWKEWETRLGSFPRFPRGVISTAIFSPFPPTGGSEREQHRRLGMFLLWVQRRAEIFSPRR